MCSFLLVDFSPQDGLYVQTNSVNSAGATYVPVYHPVNTPPCDCHLHYGSSATHKLSHDVRPHKTDSNHSTNPRNQRLNGLVGCVHHHVNGISPAAWHGHAYTLPYMPGPHLHQIPAIPAKVSPRQLKPPQTSPRYKEQHNLSQRLPNGKVSISPKSEKNESS